MALDFNTTPYFDDYDESKNFYRILFRAGVSVQTRELTQLQTILQTQIERHGSHTFKEGAKVFGAELSYENKLQSIKVRELFGTNFVEDYVADLVGQKITGANSSVEAFVIDFTPATTTDPLTLYVTYTSTGKNRVASTFTNSENIICESATGPFSAGNEVLQLVQSNAAATGIGARVTQGVFYVKGHFVLVNEQFHVVSKYTNEVDKKIGLMVNESIVTSTGDQTLLDNAGGTTNFAASGADRYAIDLDLTSVPSTENLENFIELDRIRNGVVQAKTRTTAYNELGRQLAQRTYDVNGNFVIKPFKVAIKEALNDYKNHGVYDSGAISDSGNLIIDDSYGVIQISEGEAYVYGFEIESTGSQFIDVEKPRDFLTIENSSVPIEIGNYIRINNAYNLPDVVSSDVNFEDYPTLELRSAPGSVDGTAAGDLIGVARARSIEFDGGSESGSVDSIDDEASFKLYLFDIKMLQKITLSGSESLLNIQQGTKITGLTTGAIGYVYQSSGNEIFLSSVSGNFSTGEGISSNHGTEISETISTIKKYEFSEVKQTFAAGTPNFTADLVLENEFQLSGTVTAASSATLTGLGSSFISEVRPGDTLDIGGTDYSVVSIASNTSLVIDQSITTPPTSVIRKRATINEQDRNLSIRTLAKPYMKSLRPGGTSGSDIQFRRQYNLTSNPSGEISAVAGGSTTFEPVNNKDYQVVVVVAGTGSAAAGDIINVNSDEISVSGSGTGTLTLTSLSLFGSGAEVKLNTTLLSTQTPSKTKSPNIGAKTRVENKFGLGGIRHWGTSSHHEEISLGVADVYKVHAVLDSEVVGQDAVAPTMALTNQSGTFAAGEIITGSISGASALILNGISPLEYVLLSEITFNEGEDITGSSGTATISTLTSGSRIITNRFLLDTGQRDNYYDISKLVLKQRVAKPTGNLLIIYDYFSHGSGLYFDVDSYSAIDYKNIPVYSATRIDPDSPNTTGLFKLNSAFDFRPRVRDVGTVTSGVRTVNEPSFDFASRSFSGAGSSDTPTPKDNSLFRYDFEYFLGRTDSLYLTPEGEWVLVKGEPSENPLKPEEIPNAMLIADIYMEPYVVNIGDIGVDQSFQKRYRMEDIGRLEDRINNIEYYTALSLLEASVENLQIKDSDGLDRFKSGFLVDDFEGHRIGDTANQDYKCAIDMVSGTLRPQYISKNIALEIVDPSIAGIKISDNIVTLDYEDEVTISQPFATRVESLTPLLTSAWVGHVKLSPSSDEWFEERLAPDVTVNVEGNFDAVLRANRNALGTVWGATQTSWTGVRQTETRETVSRTVTRERRRNFIDDNGSVGFIRNRIERADIVRTIETQTGTRTTSGVRTSIIPRVTTRLESSRIISNDVIPFMRSRRIFFEARGLRPYTHMYPFFDNVNVSNFVTPTGGGVVGPIIQLPTNTDGTWSTISRVNLLRFSALNSGGSENATIRVLTSADNINFTQIVAQTFSDQPETNSSVNSDFTGLDLSPNSQNGEIYIRIELENMGVTSIGELQVFDEGGNIIEGELYEVESSKNIAQANATLPGRSGQALLDADLLRVSRNASITYKILDGAKSVVPASGTISTFQNSGIEGGALVTDVSGKVQGFFTIPDPTIVGNPQFRTGNRTFRLSSSTDNSDLGLTTAGEAQYSANGVLQTRQNTFVATRNGEIVRENVRRTSTVRRSQVIDERRQEITVEVTDWFDPLAQSFQITRAGGEFLTKFDIFFSNKDDKIPVRAELREMENGQPTAKIISGSVVMKDSVDIVTSTDGSSATTFTFDHPIYVKEGIELCLVLISDSEQYRVFISRMGETNISDGATVSRQPYLGVLFKSQNTSTWTAYDNEDLKFTLYRAKFDTNSATITLGNIDPNIVTLDEDPIQCFAGSNVVRVNHRNHHMHGANEYVEISGIEEPSTVVDMSNTLLNSDTGTLVVNTNSIGVGPGFYRITNTSNDETEVIQGTASLNGVNTDISITARNVQSSTGVAQTFTAGESNIKLISLNGIPVYELNKVHSSVANQGLDYYTIQTATSAATNTFIGGTSVAATQNALLNNYQLMVPTITHNGTSLSITSSMTTGASVNGNETAYVQNLTGNAVTMDMIDVGQAAVIASKPNRDNQLSGNNSFKASFVLGTTSDNLSPVIDLERTSVSCHANRLENIQSKADIFPTDSFVAPTEPEGDSGEAIYITKRVQLRNPATAIKAYLDVALISGSGIQVMYKLLRSDDSIEFDEIGWQYFNKDGSPDTEINPSANLREFKEYEYSADNLPEFIGFAIKVRMIGDDISNPPLIQNLRAIALAM